jgi:sarcosine oxidase
VTDYDVIVIGCGGVGSAALYHLASRGYRALAIDRFPPGHDRGSSHGETRVIRQAYFEHPDYVPMLQRAYQLWEELGNEVGSPLFHKTGVLQLGPERGEVIAGVLESARLHGLDVSRIDHHELTSTYPGFRAPDSLSAVFEANAGYLEVEACIHAHVDLAEKQGARLSIGEAVLEWHNNGSDVTVRTDKSTYQAQSLIVTAGSWSSDLLPGLDLTVRRKHLHWYANDDPVYREDNGCPVFFFELDHGLFYGFPQRDTLGVKVSEHSGGETLTDPLNVDRSIDTADQATIETFLKDHLPGVGGTPTRHEVCMYTMSPDGHFIADRVPDQDNVVFAAGLSGHGFKFANVLGELMAELATSETATGSDFLSLQRFS